MDRVSGSIFVCAAAAILLAGCQKQAPTALSKEEPRQTVVDAPQSQQECHPEQRGDGHTARPGGHGGVPGWTDGSANMGRPERRRPKRRSQNPQIMPIIRRPRKNALTKSPVTADSPTRGR